MAFKMTVYKVLEELRKIRRLTSPPNLGEPVDRIIEADSLLLDLQERLLNDYGDNPQSTTFQG